MEEKIGKSGDEASVRRIFVVTEGAEKINGIRVLRGNARLCPPQ